MARWRIHFSQQLNIFGVNDDSQAEVQTAEPLVPESRAFELEIAIKNLKRNKSPGIDQILAEVNKDVLPEEWNDSIIVPIYKKE